MTTSISPDQPPVAAGTVSTTIFVASLLPMMWRAIRTRDLSSYSTGHLVLGNAANTVHTVYVLSLPAGPLWALHAVYLTVTALMLAWKMRWRRTSPRPTSSHTTGTRLNPTKQHAKPR